MTTGRTSSHCTWPSTTDEEWATRHLVVALLPIEDADRGGARIVKRVENHVRVFLELARGITWTAGRARRPRTATTAESSAAAPRKYVLRHTGTGEIKQVGASCITLFLGVKVALWTLEYDLGPAPARHGRAGVGRTGGGPVAAQARPSPSRWPSPRAGAATSPAPGPGTARFPRPRTPSQPPCEGWATETSVCIN
jgi:hypothetical protein